MFNISDLINWTEEVKLDKSMAAAWGVLFALIYFFVLLIKQAGDISG